MIDSVMDPKGSPVLQAGNSGVLPGTSFFGKKDSFSPFLMASKDLTATFWAILTKALWTRIEEKSMGA